MLRTDADGKLSLSGDADGPPFERIRRGWYWQVIGPRNTLRSASLDGETLDDVATDARDRSPPAKRADDAKAKAKRPSPADGPGPDDQALHYRIQKLSIGSNPVTIVASAPRAAVWGPLREAMTTLAISLLALGLALIAAIVLQIQLGLRPLKRLRQAIADIRAGRIDRVPGRQPREIQPVVDELHGLLGENAANLERARRNVANLAHGLKTPLATLAVGLSSREAHTASTDLYPLVDMMERRIRHHLGRARVAVLSGPARTRTLIAPRIGDIGDAMAKIYAGKHIRLFLEIDADLAVACEPQDFDEMAGNIIDNAFKWARSNVAIRVHEEQRMTVLAVEDDGAGLSDQQVAQVLRPGQRLDEAAPGFGFGLSITRELAELYGGGLDFNRSAMGGLFVSLRLPAAGKK
jgi:signal transduction histidine kinase